MAKRIRSADDIKTVSYVHVGDKLVNTDELTPDQKARLANELTLRYLNALFRGQAEFYMEER